MWRGANQSAERKVKLQGVVGWYGVTWSEYSGLYMIQMLNKQQESWSYSPAHKTHSLTHTQYIYIYIYIYIYVYIYIYSIYIQYIECSCQCGLCPVIAVSVLSAVCCALICTFDYILTGLNNWSRHQRGETLYIHIYSVWCMWHTASISVWRHRLHLNLHTTY